MKPHQFIVLGHIGYANMGSTLCHLHNSNNDIIIIEPPKEEPVKKELTPFESQPFIINSEHFKKVVSHQEKAFLKIRKGFHKNKFNK